MRPRAALAKGYGAASGSLTIEGQLSLVSRQLTTRAVGEVCPEVTSGGRAANVRQKCDECARFVRTLCGVGAAIVRGLCAVCAGKSA
jgi:hypothetical protein